MMNNTKNTNNKYVGYLYIERERERDMYLSLALSVAGIGTHSIGVAKEEEP